MILTRSHHYYPKQYGLGLKVYRGIRGDGIFSSIKRYAFPVGKFLLNKIIKPFVKNNRGEIKNMLSQQSQKILKRLVSGKRPIVEEAISDVRDILRSKTLSEHLRGEGIKRMKL